jgi:hypothetical protein
MAAALQLPGEPASTCTNRGHLRPGLIKSCDLRGQPARQFLRSEEALIRRVIGHRSDDNAIEMRMIGRTEVPLTEEFSAILRFRSDRKTTQVLAS